MSLGLIPLALLMWLVTYPSRTLPMLAPGIERLPPAAVTYLRLAGPSALAALAAVNCLLTSTSPTSLLIGIEPVGVLVCIVVVAWSKQLLPGVAAAVILVAVVRALGLG